MKSLSERHSSTRLPAGDLSRRVRPPLRISRLAHALAAVSLLTLWPEPTTLRAQTLPSGMNIVAGQATARTVGNTLTVTNAPGTILNWNSFSIGAQNAVRFDQASASSQVLNRVTGTDPSSILGSLSSNGRVWLLNPNGVLFGQGARVDVASLVTSTLNLNDADWLAGRYRFTQGSGPAADIVNQGDLRSSLGGHIALIGGTVRNEGDITASGGQIVLAAGSDIELLDTATPNVIVKVNAGEGNAFNLGRLMAAGGRIDIHAATVNQDGIVRADALQSGPGGEVVLSARDQLTLGAASQTTANGDSGGKITLQADQTMVRGELGATGSQGAGGQVRVLGRQVGLLDAGLVDASGAGGGGEVLVGGGPQGKDPSVPNAQAVYFGPSASILADATASGDGGRIVLWSDLATRAYGSLSARGGPLGGNGGLVETSGGWLDARPSRLNLSAARGKGGQWLLDPFDVTINDAGPDAGYDPVTFTANANGSTISTGVIKGELEVGNSVTISTGGGTGGQAGNITMANSSLFVNSSGPGDLTLIADGNISMSGSTIQSQSAPMNVSLLAGRGGDGGISLVNSSIVSGNGNITLSGFGHGIGISGPFSGASSSAGYGVQIVDSNLDAGSGNLGGVLSIAGASGGLNAGVSISLASGIALFARNITVTGSSTGGNGVEFLGASHLTSSGDITVQGVGQNNGVSLSAGSYLLSQPGVSSNSVLSVVGASMGGASGVVAAGTLQANNGDSVSVSASNTFGSNPALLVSGNISVLSAPGSLTLSIINPAVNNDILVTNNATLTGGAGGILITGARVLTLQDTTASAHAIQLQADVIDFEGATSLVSNQPSGDVFVLSNRNNNGPLINFTNNSTVGTGGSGALQTSGAPARWIIWASDITSASFNPGSLPYDFTQYNATSPAAWSGISGNGYVSFSPAAATVLGTIAPRVYDTTLNVPLQGSLQATGPRGETALFISPPGLQYADKNVGTAKPVELFGSYSVSFTDTLGKPAYGLTLQSGMTGDVTPALVSVQGLSGNTKTYDATTTATYSGTPSVTPLGSDSLSVSLPNGAPAFFADKNVGNSKLITVPSMSLTGADAGNYVLVPSSGLTGNILPFQLILSGVSANNKVYDATTAATVTGTPSVNIFPGDSVSPLSIVNALFSTKSAGTNKVVQVFTSNLTGADAGNYTLDFASTLLQATITPAPLALTGLSPADKVYDTTTAATLRGTAGVTPLAGDSVSLVGTPIGNFADKNVGTAKPVSVNNVGLAGSDSANYVLVAPGSLTASITPATLTVNGLVANDKVYDATVLATFSGTASVTPLGNDVVSLSSAPVGTFSDKNVGTAKPVSISALSLTGADAGNYVPVAPSGLSASITPASLAVSGLVANNKVYDATVAATLSGTASVTPLGGDSVAVTGSPTGSFSSPNVGTGKTVLIAGLGLTGPDAANYLLPASVTATANIDPATLYYLATLVTLPVGTPPPALSGTVYGLKGSETLQSATTGALSFSTSATGQSPAGAYPILGSGLSAINYTFAQDPGNATALNYTVISPVQAAAAAGTTPLVTAPQLMAHPLSVDDPNKAGVVNLVPTASPPISTTPPPDGASAFAPARLSDMSPSELQGMLDARASYKQFILSDSTSQLERDPALADLPACQRPQDLSSGTCLISADMKREMHAGRQGKAPAKPGQQAASTQAAPAVDKPVAKGSVALAPAPAPAPSGAVAAATAQPAGADLPEALLHLTTPRVRVANLPQIVRKVALVIGVNRYTDPDIPALSNAVGDARAVGDVFESNLGYDSIVLENPSKQTVVAALTQLALALDPQDSVVVYYAGHGQLVESTGLGYWLLSDSDAKRPQTWLSNADIGRLVRQIGASQVALISDSCYSGSLVSEQRIRATPGTVDPQQVLSRRSAVVMSSGGNEPVADEGRDGHSPFAWNLMNNLRQLSKWQPGGNVFERVRFAVARALPQRPQYGAFGAAGDQGGGDYLFEQRQLESAPQ